MENPFKPTAGKMPPMLIGRDAVIDEFVDGLQNGAGAPERLMRITGARGTGKTVMLNELGRIAAQRGWDVVDEVANVGFCTRVLERLLPRTRLSGVRAEPSVFGFSLGGVELERASLTLREAMTRRIDEGSCRGLLITLDEVQDASLDETRALAVAVQQVIGDDRDIAFVFAGLPSMVDNVVDGKTLTFLRRAIPEVLHPVYQDDVADAFLETIRGSGMRMDGSVAQTLAAASRGYPFMVQLVGYYAWQSAFRRDGEHATLGKEDAERGIEAARRRFDATVIEPALQRLSPRLLTYLMAMAQDGTGPSRTADVAERMGTTLTAVSPLRDRLLREGIIEAPSRGVVSFAIPYLSDYLRIHRAELVG